MVRCCIRLLRQWEAEDPLRAAVNWPEVVRQLTGWASYRYHIPPNQLLPGCCKTLEECVLETCELLFLDPSQWDGERHPTVGSVVAFLKRVLMRDLLDASYRKRGGKRRLLKGEEPLQNDCDARPAPPRDDPAERMDGDARIAHLQDSAADFFAQYVKIRSDDPGLRPREIAELMGVPIHEVHNMRKRLERAVIQQWPESMLQGREKYEQKRRTAR